MKWTGFGRTVVVAAALAVASIVTAQMAGDSWRAAAALPQGKGVKAVMAKVQSDGNRELIIRYRVPDLVLAEIMQDSAYGKRTRLQLGNAPLRGNEGEPVLPVIPVQFVVPFGREIAAIEVQGEKRATVLLKAPLEYGSAPVPLMPGYNAKKAVPKAAIFESNQVFPPRNSEPVTVQQKRGVSIGIVNLHPVAYFPKYNRLEYCKEFEIRVKFKAALKADRKALRLRLSSHELKKLGIENPEAIHEYRDSSRTLKGAPEPEQLQMLLDPSESFQYVVITSEAMRDAVTDVTINDLVSHRQSLGLTAALVTIESILANYNGIDNAEKVRNFIIDAYTNWETEYVVLGGDVNIIPIRYLYSDWTNIPSDLYYQCLDGSFNGDGDMYWGEPNDGDGGGDVDLFAEVYVGRISAENAEEMSNAVYKILAYEKDAESEEYLRYSCMVGEELGPSFGSGIFGFAKPFMNEIKNGSSASGYTTAGFRSCAALTVDSLDDWDAYWPVDSIIAFINSNKYSVLNHLGHANTNYVMKMVNSQADNLTNSKFLFCLSQGCFPGDLTMDCIAEHLTTSTRHGFFSGVFNAHYGWGAYNDSYETLDGPSQRINRQFWDAYFNEYIFNLGAINADSHEDNVWNINGEMIRWCIYETNLFGDPYTVIRGQTQGPKLVFKAVTIDDRSGGNGDNIINPGEQVALSISLRNIGNEAATGVSALLTITDPYISISNGTLAFGDMPCCGVVTSSSNRASIAISADCPTPYSFPITIEINDNSGNSWAETFTLTVHTSYTISGRVLTFTGSNPVAGARIIITGPINGETVTGDAGEYLFTGIEGTYSVRAEAAGYLPVKPVEVTLPPSATGVDFMVKRPQISIDPVTISHMLTVNDSAELPLDIFNSGDAALNFSIAALDKTASESLPAHKIYDSSHFVKLPKGAQDSRIGHPVTLGSGGPDRFGYRWADSDEPGGPQYEWNDISSTGSRLSTVSGCDDCFESRPLSFKVPFYGVEHSAVFIGSNGYCTFGEGSSQHWNVALPSPEAPANLVAAFFDDLYPGRAGDVYFQDFGTYAVVQFNEVAYFNHKGSVTFQIVIDRYGAITYYYNTLTGPVNEMTAGIQNETRDDGLTVVYNAAYLRNNFAVRLQPTPGWLTVAPEEGTVPAGGSLRCIVKLNSAGLIGGEYTAELKITHNDPQQISALSVPVALSVDGFKSLVASPLSINFGNLWLGLKETIDVTLANTGTQSTIVSAISSSNTSYIVNASLPLRIRPGREAKAGIIFAPQALGPSSAYITIVSDAEDNPSIVIDASGVATRGPEARLTPTEMVFDLGPKDAPVDRTAVLENVGGDVLSYRTYIRQKSKPSFATAPALTKEKKRDIERLIYSPYNYRNEFALDRVIVALVEGKDRLANPQLLSKLGSGNVRELASARIPRKGARTYNGKKLFLIPLANNSRDGVLEAIKLLREDINVAYAEPDYRVWAIGVPNDPLFPRQYALDNSGQTGGTADADIDAVEGWDIFTGENSDVILGIIDTGIDYLHPDLAGNIWTNAGEIPGNGIDDDLNGYVDDVYGYDFAYDDNDPMDVYGHGTHCSGIAAGRGNDGVGICGVSWGAKLMALKFLNDEGWGWTSDAIDAIAYAAAMGATITSNSWGGGGYEQSLYDMIASGGLFVAAAGNNGSNADLYPMYPAAYDLDNIISVAATDHNDALAYFSNYGLTSVDLGAPGVDILSCLPGNSHEEWSGTSMATPHVSGCAVLLKTYNPLATTAEIKSAILNSVDAVEALEGKTVSGGRLNLAKAIKSISPPWITLSPMTPGTLDIGEQKQFTVTANPKGLVAGTWVAEIVYNTDDPFTPDHILTVTANILPCRTLHAAQDPVMFNTVWAGRDTMVNLVLVNECNAPVTVSSVSFADQVFTTDQQFPLLVPPFGSSNVPVRFSPQAAGTYQSTATVTSDAEDNPSLIVAIYATSVTPPVISVSPTEIELTMAYETTETAPVTLTNSGGADYLFKVKTVRPPKEDRAAKKLVLSDATVFVSLYGDTIRRLDIETGEFTGEPIVKPVRSYSSEGLAFDGEYLYFTYASPRISVIDPETGKQVRTIDCKVGDANIDGLGVTDDYIILGDYWYGRILICDKKSGELVASWDALGYYGSLTASESRGSIFYFNWYDNTVEERSILDGTLLNTISVSYYFIAGLGYSEGANVLVAASPYYGVLIIDPDNKNVVKTLPIYQIWSVAADETGWNLKWLSSAITEGTVPFGQSLSFNAIINSAKKLPGSYEGILRIEHRRPIAPGPYDVRCAMTVLEEKRCAASPSSLSFTETWVERTDTLPFYLVNSGNAATEVYSITSNNTLFKSYAATPLVIQPFDSVIVPTGFTPKKAATVFGKLNISSDAVKSPSVTVTLKGTGLNPPKISYSPAQLAKVMLPGKELETSVNLKNMGGADYRFLVKIESIEDGTDKTGRARLFGINWRNIFSLDPNTGAVISSVSGRYAYGHCAFDGEYLFVSRDWSDSIDVIDPASGSIVRSMRLSGNSAHTVYEMGISDRFIITLNPDYSGAAKGYLVTVCSKADGSLQYSWQVDWWVEGLCNGRDAGTLFTYDYKRKALDTRLIKTGEVIRSVSVEDFGWTITYSRALDALYMSTDYEVRMINPATGEVTGSFSLPDYMYIAADEVGVSWLQTAVDSSAVPAKGSYNLKVKFNSARLLPGKYKANIRIAHHKDWQPGPFIIPCELTVLPIKKLAATPASLDFGTVWIGKDSAQAITLQNDGNVTTTVYSIATLTNVFSFEPKPPFTVNPFSSVKIKARFTPNKATGFKDAAAIISDAVDLPVRIVKLSGNGVNPPAVTVDPQRFNVQLPPGGVSQETLKLVNSGGAGYAFRITGYERTMQTAGGETVLYAANGNSILRLDPETFEQIGDPIIPDSDLWINGLAFDGQNLFVPNNYNEYVLIYRIDPLNPAAIDTITTGIHWGWITGLGVTDKYILALEYDHEKLYFLDKNTGAITREISVSAFGALTAAADRGSFFVFNYNTWSIDEMSLESGSVINSFPLPEMMNDYPSGAAFSTTANVLFLCNYEGLIVTLDPDNGTVLSSVYTDYWDLSGLAADEAPALPSWLALSMKSGIVPRGGKIDIGVTFDATQLPPGVFQGEIKVTPVVAGAPGPFIIPCDLSVSEGEAASRK